MATKLFLRSTQANGIGATYFDMVTTAGAGSTTAVVACDGSTQKQWTQTSGGALIQWISGRAPAGGFTLTTTDISIWAHESATAANAGGRYRLFKRAANGTETELDPASAYDDGVEFTKDTPTEMTWAGNPTDTAFAENDRILLKLYITNVGSMGSAQTCTLTYNAADAATGDSFLNIAETVTFKSEETAINANVASLTTTTFSAATNIETAFTANAASLTQTSYAASLNVETGVSASAGSLTFTTQAATVTGTAPPIEVNANTATLTLSSQAAAVKTNTSFTANAAAMTFSAQNATVSVAANVEVSANAASLALSAFAAAVKENISFSASSTAMTLTGFVASVKADTSFTAGTVAVGFSSFPATVTVTTSTATEIQAQCVPPLLVARAASIRTEPHHEFVVMEARRRRVNRFSF